MRGSRVLQLRPGGLGLPQSNSIPRMQRGLPSRQRIDKVDHVIAVSSAKGGVGKSTVAASLAVIFAQNGLRSGILDTDVFGPSIPTLFGLNDQPNITAKNKLVPLTSNGVKTMSMGYLVPAASPLVWRGLMVMKAMEQLLLDVDWGGLDVLVLDLPPGTGDTQLGITQLVELDGALVVTTPHHLALDDAARGINMFRKLPVPVPVLGLVNNMATLQCPCCREVIQPFGNAAAMTAMCEQLQVEKLADLPLIPRPSAAESIEGKGRPWASIVASDNAVKSLFSPLVTSISNKLGIMDATL